MEPVSSLSCSQHPATVPYPESDESDQHPKPCFPGMYFNVILPSTPRSSKCSHLLRLDLVKRSVCIVLEFKPRTDILFKCSTRIHIAISIKLTVCHHQSKTYL
jgi:hypothetical protein